MKITKKNLEKLIKEEIAIVLSEQSMDPSTFRPMVKDKLDKIIEDQKQAQYTLKLIMQQIARLPGYKNPESDLDISDIIQKSQKAMAQDAKEDMDGTADESID